MRPITATYKLLKRLAGAAVIPLIVGFAFFGPIKLVAWDVALLFFGIETEGLVNSAEQEAESVDTGQTIWSHHTTYFFKTVDGRLVRGSESSTGMLRPEFVDLQEPVPVVVEYLPGQPTVNRLRGGDRISLASLAIRVLLALAFIGVWLWFVYHSILQFRKDQATHGDPGNAA